MLSFAIAVPHLDQIELLPTALESLKHQDVQVNVALMDGGSRADLSGVLDRYGNVLTLYRKGSDLGQADAIARGISHLEGEILGWLNSDDYYFPFVLGEVERIFSSNPDVDIVYGDAVHVDRECNFLSYFPAIEDFDETRLTSSCFICQPACFIRRSAYFEVGGLDRSLKYTMDWDLWCKLSGRRKVFLRIKKPLAAVRYYQGTKTLSGDFRRYQEIWRIQRRYGRKPLPTSWPGFYWFDLSMKKRTPLEEVFFSVLEKGRRIKKILKGDNKSLNYGFLRWERTAIGTGRIQFPWYGGEGQFELAVDVLPPSQDYLVVCNREKAYQIHASKTRLSVPIFLTNASVVDVTIRCASQEVWQLLNCSVSRVC